MNTFAARRWWTFLVFPLAAVLPVNAQDTAVAAPARQGSTVFRFEDLAVKPTAVGERRDVTDLPTATLERFECHVSTLNASRASHPPHTHPQEELIILRDGTLDVNANGRIQRAGPGSLFFFAANQPHAVQNNGDKPATYFVFNFATAATRSVPPVGAPPVPGKLASTVMEWDRLPVQATKTGERRNVLDAPTATLTYFECHVTTIEAGQSPHAPHRHPDEEILLVKEGQLDVTVNGVTRRAGPGAICFFGANDEHGLRNAGEGRATYYVLRVVTAATPARVATY